MSEEKEEEVYSTNKFIDENDAWKLFYFSYILVLIISPSY